MGRAHRGGAANQTFTHGGAYVGDYYALLDERRGYEGDGWVVGSFIGFRVATTPEPGTGLLVFTGLIGLAARRRALHT